MCVEIAESSRTYRHLRPATRASALQTRLAVGTAAMAGAIIHGPWMGVVRSGATFIPDDVDKQTL